MFRYLGRASAQVSNLIHAAEDQPTYIGSDYETSIPLSGAPGRPSVRISTKKAWTHGLFVGDFKHAPGGVCGSWPACTTRWTCTGISLIVNSLDLGPELAISRRGRYYGRRQLEHLQRHGFAYVS